MQLPFITYGMALYDMYNDKTLLIANKIYEYASELDYNLFAFSHSKTAISFNILLVLIL